MIKKKEIKKGADILVVPDGKSLHVGGAVEKLVLGSKEADFGRGLGGVHHGLQRVILVQVVLENEGGNQAVL